MVITCPACNKANQTEAVCQRCGCDLSRLHTIVEFAASRLNAAVTSLAVRDLPEALAQAERSWRLYHTAASARVAFMASAAMGETQRTLRWREREGVFEKDSAR